MLFNKNNAGLGFTAILMAAFALQGCARNTGAQKEIGVSGTSPFFSVYRVAQSEFSSFVGDGELSVESPEFKLDPKEARASGKLHFTFKADSAKHQQFSYKARISSKDLKPRVFNKKKDRTLKVATTDSAVTCEEMGDGQVLCTQEFSFSEDFNRNEVWDIMGDDPSQGTAFFANQGKKDTTALVIEVVRSDGKTVDYSFQADPVQLTKLLGGVPTERFCGRKQIKEIDKHFRNYFDPRLVVRDAASDFDRGVLTYTASVEYDVQQLPEECGAGAPPVLKVTLLDGKPAKKQNGFISFITNPLNPFKKSKKKDELSPAITLRDAGHEGAGCLSEDACETEFNDEGYEAPFGPGTVGGTYSILATKTATEDAFNGAPMGKLPPELEHVVQAQVVYTIKYVQDREIKEYSRTVKLTQELPDMPKTMNYPVASLNEAIRFKLNEDGTGIVKFRGQVIDPANMSNEGNRFKYRIRNLAKDDALNDSCQAEARSEGPNSDPAWAISVDCPMQKKYIPEEETRFALEMSLYSAEKGKFLDWEQIPNGIFRMSTTGDTGPDLLSISPKPVSTTVKVGTVILFSAEGGEGAYTFYVTNGTGTGTIDASSGRFEATKDGTVTVGVRDGAENKDEVSFTIQKENTPAATPLAVAPTTATVTLNATQQFTASGGTAPYTFSVSPSTLGTVTSSGLFTGKQAGSGQVIVKDSLNRSVSAAVTVTDTPTDPVAISPTTVKLALNGTQQFTAIAGKAPFTFSVTPSTLGTVTSAGLFTAKQLGTGQVTVKDSLNRTASAAVTVEQSVPVTATAEATQLFAGKSTKITAAGGSGSYVCGISGGSKAGSVSMSGSICTYTAPSVTFEGYDIVTIADKNDVANFVTVKLGFFKYNIMVNYVFPPGAPKTGGTKLTIHTSNALPKNVTFEVRIQTDAFRDCTSVTVIDDYQLSCITPVMPAATQDAYIFVGYGGSAHGFPFEVTEAATGTLTLSNLQWNKDNLVASWDAVTVGTGVTVTYSAWGSGAATSSRRRVMTSGTSARLDVRGPDLAPKIMVQARSSDGKMSDWVVKDVTIKPALSLTGMKYDAAAKQLVADPASGVVASADPTMDKVDYFFNVYDKDMKRVLTTDYRASAEPKLSVATLPPGTYRWQLQAGTQGQVTPYPYYIQGPDFTITATPPVTTPQVVDRPINPTTAGGVRGMRVKGFNTPLTWGDVTLTAGDATLEVQEITPYSDYTYIKFSAPAHAAATVDLVVKKGTEELRIPGFTWEAQPASLTVEKSSIAYDAATKTLSWAPAKDPQGKTYSVSYVVLPCLDTECKTVAPGITGVIHAGFNTSVSLAELVAAGTLKSGTTYYMGLAGYAVNFGDVRVETVSNPIVMP